MGQNDGHIALYLSLVSIQAVLKPVVINCNDDNLLPFHKETSLFTEN